MNQFPAKNLLLLFLTAFIWGTAFVAQSVGMDHIGPFTFNAIRPWWVALPDPCDFDFWPDEK